MKKNKFNKGDLVEFNYSGRSGVIVRICAIPPFGRIQYRVHLSDGRKRWTLGADIKKVA
jgi:hypothetical protein